MEFMFLAHYLIPDQGWCRYQLTYQCLSEVPKVLDLPATVSLDTIQTKKILLGEGS